MQKCFYPMMANRISGSEVYITHKGTKCLDMATNGDPYAYAFADIKVVKIDRACNTVWFTSLDQVEAVTFTDIITVRMAHMNDYDFNNLGIAIGKVFKQGERCYRMGMKGTTATHIHNEWGRGKIKGAGWYKLPNGNWTIDTTGGSVHMWDTTFLKKGTPIYRFNDGMSPQDKYNWIYIPTLVYQLHVQDIGNTPLVKDGEIAGTVGRSLRSEAVRIYADGIKYRPHIQTNGWLPFVGSGEWAGTMGVAKRLECIEIVAPAGRIISGQAHVANIGWMDVVSGSTIQIGTVGKGLAIEAIKLWMTA